MNDHFLLKNLNRYFQLEFCRAYCSVITILLSISVVVDSAGKIIGVAHIHNLWRTELFYAVRISLA